MAFNGPRGLPPVNRDVPIIGQPVAIHSWFPIINWTCKCENPVIMMTAGLDTISQCPNCKKRYQLVMGFDTATNSIVIAVNLVAAEPEPEAARLN